MNEKELIKACEDGNLENVKSIIKSGGVNINTKNSDGETALIVASSCLYLEIVRYLIKNGADINAKDNNGRTPRRKA